MKVYVNYFKLRIITFLQYREAAIAGLCTQFFWGMMLIFIYMALYQNGANSSISFDKSFNNSNKSKYEQICNFSNQMIKDSLSERHKKSIYKNIKILKNIYK